MTDNADSTTDANANNNNIDIIGSVDIQSTDELLLTLPSISNPPTRAEVVELVRQFKHDLVGLLQAVKVGLDLLSREQLDPKLLNMVVGLMRANCERGFAYGQQLAEYAEQLEEQ